MLAVPVIAAGRRTPGVGHLQSPAGPENAGSQVASNGCRSRTGIRHRVRNLFRVIDIRPLSRNAFPDLARSPFKNPRYRIRKQVLPARIGSADGHMG